MTFPEHLRATRRRLQYTQQELAAALGVTMQSVWNWENGHREPWPTNRARLTARLNELGSARPYIRQPVCERI